VSRAQLILAWALSLWLLALGASADDSRAFSYNARLELPLLSAGAALWLTSELLKPQLGPAECRVCGVNALDRSVQEHLRWSSYNGAHFASDVLLFGVVPAAAFGGAALMAHVGGASRRDMFIDLLMIGEALVLTAGLTQATKFAVARERPYVRTQRAEARDFVATPDDHLSFFSGHTSSTFALAVATGTTASLRGYRQAPAVWSVGLPLALLTGYLRIAADRHYFTDVLTGALVGSAVGVFVPWLHTHSRQAPTMGMAQPGTLTFTWVR
jgi:membrane-associated phospholipid phosphatase